MVFSAQCRTNIPEESTEMTEWDRDLEEALLEYVERYGLTDKARAVLTSPPNRRTESGLPGVEADSDERLELRQVRTTAASQVSKDRI